MVRRRRGQGAEDGRYDITYDDGDEEFGVEAARVRAATGDADVLAPLPAPQDELRRSDPRPRSRRLGGRGGETQVLIAAPASAATAAAAGPRAAAPPHPRPRRRP